MNGRKPGFCPVSGPSPPFRPAGRRFRAAPVLWDLSDEKVLRPAVPGYHHDRARDVFMHEMTHVWQFHRGDSVKARSIHAQKFGAGYEFTRGAP